MGVPLFLLIGLVVFGLDQATKYWALRSMPEIGSIPIVPGFFQLTLTTNTGAAFGLMPSATPILALVALAAAAGILTYVARSRVKLTVTQGLALALPLGGALGNFTDRVWRHFVVDFFDVYVGTHHWPIFNVADSAICVGVGILMVIMLRNGSVDSTKDVASLPESTPEPSAGSQK